jgi:hypothetical protein
LRKPPAKAPACSRQPCGSAANFQFFCNWLEEWLKSRYTSPLAATHIEGLERKNLKFFSNSLKNCVMIEGFADHSKSS